MQRAVPQFILDGVKAFQPETALIVTLCSALVLDLAMRRSRVITPWVVFTGLVITLVFVGKQSSASVSSIFSGMYVVDAFSLFFKGVILVTSLLIVIFSLQSNELNAGRRKVGEYYSLLVAMTLGMVLMTGASNLLMMYLSLELTSISSYILAGYTKEAKDSS